MCRLRRLNRADGTRGGVDVPRPVHHQDENQMNVLISKAKEAYGNGGVGALLRGVGRKIKQTARASEALLQPASYYSISPARILTNENLRSGFADSACIGNLWYVPSSGRNDSIAETESHNPFPSGVSYTELRTCGYTYQPDFVRECYDVLLLGPDGIGITKDGFVLQDTSQPPGEYDPGFRRIERSIGKALNHNFIVSTGSLIADRRMDHRAVLSLKTACSFQNCFINYYHWILEQLPKLRALAHYTEQTGVAPMLILPPNPSSYIYETLNLLGIDKSTCVEWQNPAIHVDTLVVPSFPEANSENLHWLRSRLRGEAMSRQTTVPRLERVYISRKGAQNHRNIRNESEVVRTLERHGFTEVCAEHYSVAEQIRLFAGARVIVGPHGAGLTNMIWAERAKIIEIHNHVIRDYFYVLAKNLNHEYTALMGNSTDLHYLNSDIFVDVENLNKVLERLFD